jgi:transcriptional regulator with XRE-family HTH domain
MYPNLKLEIFKRGIHQNNLAKELGINEAILSKIIRGYRQPTSAQREMLARYLAVDENYLFEKFELTAARVATANSPQGTENGDS